MQSAVEVVLGLGSNLGDRLQFLYRAIEMLSSPEAGILSECVCSDLYESQALLLPDSPTEWNIPFYNAALKGRTRLSPRDLLRAIKKIELELGRGDHARWAPREIDIDILTYSSDEIRDPDLRIPHPGLSSRPFALWPFAALAPQHPITPADLGAPVPAIELCVQWGRQRARVPCRCWRASPRDQTALCSKLRRLSIPSRDGWLPRTELVGIINVTPDSFSDGGIAFSPEQAASRARVLFEQGAQILDIGAESTRPRSEPISIEQELSRLIPALSAIRDQFRHESLKPTLSIDTRHPEVAAQVLAQGIDWLNDVSGFSDQRMIDTAKEFACDLVCMHSLGIPPSSESILEPHRSAVEQVVAWGQARIEQLGRAGIPPERIILDPGIGFGKSASQSFEILANLPILQTLGTRILIGHSRKSFLSICSERPSEERDPETCALSAILCQQNVDYLRVHHIEAHTRMLSLL